MNSTQQYNQNGFAIFDHPVIDIELLQQAKARIQAITNGEYDTGSPHWGFANEHKPEQLQRIAQIHLCDKAFANLLTESRLGEVVGQLVGAKEIKVWGSQLYMKPATKPTTTNQQQANVGWHRDSQHVPFYTSGVVTAWIPLDGCDIQSGPLCYVAQSHNKGSFGMPSGAQQQDLDIEQQHLAECGGIDWHSKAVEVPMGGMSVHHWDLIHGSAVNGSDKPRYGLSVGLATETIAIDSRHYDYGYIGILENPKHCPVIYRQQGA